MISIVLPHKPGKEQDKLLALNKKMLKENTHHPYELIYVYGGDRHIVYPAFNFLISQAKYPIVVMTNTDVLFEKDWDIPLVENIDKGDWFSFRLVEAGAIGSDQIVKNFGRTADTFDENAFQQFVDGFSLSNSLPEIDDGFVWYVPCAWKKEYFLKMGGFETKDPFPTPNDIRFREKCAREGCRFKIIDSWCFHAQWAKINRGEENI